MADYIAQPDTAVDPDAPVTSDLMYALRDNPIAIAEGAAGAPRIADAALNGTLAGVTAAGSTWVGRRYAGSAWNAVGSIVMARYLAAGSGSPMNAGGTVNGSELRICAANGKISSTVSALPGTWECMGYAESGNVESGLHVTNWRRLS